MGDRFDRDWRCCTTRHNRLADPPHKCGRPPNSGSSPVSLILGTIAALCYFNSRKRSKHEHRMSMDDYFIGIDAVGASETQPAPIPVKNVSSTYWTSVAAGLTVLSIAALVGYGFQKSLGKRHDFDRVIGS